MFATKVSVKRALNCIWNFHNEEDTKETVSATFQLKELLHYLNECADEGDDKIRIYFGRYSNNNNPNLPDPDYDNRQTVIFVPMKDGKENVPDIVPLLPYNEGQLCPPLPGCDENDSLYLITQDPERFDPTTQDEGKTTHQS